MDQISGEADVAFRRREDGATRIDLTYRGRSLSHVIIAPQVVRYGATTLRVDHFGDVWTEEDCRGHGEQVLHAQNLPRTRRPILLVGVSAAMPPSRAPGRRRHAAIAGARPSP